MALKQFLSSAIKLVPQAGFSITSTENGGIEAQQDVLIRTADLSTTNAFQRGARWDSIFPEVPSIYRSLKLKKTDPTDRGDGFTLIKCTFTGYQYSGNDSSGEELTVATSTLSGQLNPDALSSHPKWEPLSAAEKTSLGNLLSGEWSYIQDPFTPGEFALALNTVDGEYSIRPAADQVTSEDGLMFLKIIAEGESTWDRAGWTYSYHTEGSKPFTAAQLNSLNKIVANPPGNPQKPSSDWCYMLASANQTQSGEDRFIKTLDFRLIPDNAKNQFLYGA
jgi:hypothetical protein